MKFIDYSTYLFESEAYHNFRYYFHYEKNKDILHIVLLDHNLCIGYINPWEYVNNNWEIVSVAAEKGFGYKMHEAVMDLIWPQWIIPARNKAIQPELINTYVKFIDREDIETERINVEDDCYVEISEEYDNWFNRKYRLKEKINIDFEETNYNFIKKSGIKLFSKKYPWGSESTLD